MKGGSPSGCWAQPVASTNPSKNFRGCIENSTLRGLVNASARRDALDTPAAPRACSRNANKTTIEPERDKRKHGKNPRFTADAKRARPRRRANDWRLIGTAPRALAA